MLDFQEHGFRKVHRSHIFGAGTRKVCYEDLNKDMFLEMQMKHVVKYDVYLDILPMASIYAINQQIRKSGFNLTLML